MANLLPYACVAAVIATALPIIFHYGSLICLSLHAVFFAWLVRESGLSGRVAQQ